MMQGATIYGLRHNARQRPALTAYEVGDFVTASLIDEMREALAPEIAHPHARKAVVGGRKIFDQARGAEAFMHKSCAFGGGAEPAAFRRLFDHVIVVVPGCGCSKRVGSATCGDVE